MGEGVTYPAGDPDVTDLGDRHFMRVDGDSILWWHDCYLALANGNPGAWSWLGTGKDGHTSGHRIISHEPLTVEPSLLCPYGCGDHGFIRGGKWVPA